ncbi:hypothetical protein BD770DRAFT_442588 [Pilaira anomala]|nr:hypothetical protein BD770DRAFT_442588 [Pilaira anomala]
MLRVNPNLDVNVRVYVSLRFIKDKGASKEKLSIELKSMVKVAPVLVDNGLQEEEGYKSEKSKLHLVNANYCSPVDYFIQLKKRDSESILYRIRVTTRYIQRTYTVTCLTASKYLVIDETDEPQWASGPCTKECDNKPGMHHPLATVKRLVKPWTSSGRTLIADARFRSPDIDGVFY